MKSESTRYIILGIPLQISYVGLIHSNQINKVIQDKCKTSNNPICPKNRKKSNYMTNSKPLNQTLFSRAENRFTFITVHGTLASLFSPPKVDRDMKGKLKP